VPPVEKKILESRLGLIWWHQYPKRKRFIFTNRCRSRAGCHACHAQKSGCRLRAKEIWSQKSNCWVEINSVLRKTIAKWALPCMVLGLLFRHRLLLIFSYL